MKTWLLATMILISGPALASRSVRDAGASGDKRAILTDGLKLMGAVSVPTPQGLSGSYIGLYNVECYYLGYGGFTQYCKAAPSPSEYQHWNSTSAAVLIGSVLQSNVEWAYEALVVKAKVVACNLNGDNCIIKDLKLLNNDDVDPDTGHFRD